jgi:UDP-glucuronate 4-epimerase
LAILVTGAMGHVGYETVRQAVAAGETVVAQYRSTFRQADADAVGGDVTWVSCDLADQAAVEALCNGRGIDRCIHSAAVPNEQSCRPDPLAAVQTNIGAAANLLDIARRQGWKRFIYVSTGSVFQNATDVGKTVVESAVPSGTTIYSTTKYCGELITEMYRTQLGLPAAVVRISWVYGPPLITDDVPRGPIPAFLKAAIAGQPIRLPGGSDFAASFTYVGDVAAGLLAACRAPELKHGVYHLGSGVNYTAGQVAAAIRAAVPAAEIDLGPGTEPWTIDTRMRGPLGGDRLRDDTGFTVTHSLESGIRAYADWMRVQPGALR